MRAAEDREEWRSTVEDVWITGHLTSLFGRTGSKRKCGRMCLKFINILRLPIKLSVIYWLACLSASLARTLEPPTPVHRRKFLVFRLCGWLANWQFASSGLRVISLCWRGSNEWVRIARFIMRVRLNASYLSCTKTKKNELDISGAVIWKDFDFWISNLGSLHYFFTQQREDLSACLLAYSPTCHPSHGPSIFCFSIRLSAIFKISNYGKALLHFSTF